MERSVFLAAEECLETAEERALCASVLIGCGRLRKACQGFHGRVTPRSAGLAGVYLSSGKVNESPAHAMSTQGLPTCDRHLS